MDKTEETADEPLLPPKPEEPLDSECCGTGCTPCVFDIYKEKVKRWKQDCDKIRQGGCLSVLSHDENSEFINPFEYKKFVVLEVIEDCTSCKIIRLKKETNSIHFFSNSSFPIKLGQHLVIRIDNKSRQYTLLDINENNAFDIIFKIYPNGWLTPSIDRLVVGDTVEIRGPFGNEFCYKPNTIANIVLFACGTGIAPFVRLVDRILENEKDESGIRLMFACRNENEVLLQAKLKEWARYWNFKVQYYLSDVHNSENALKIHYGSQINLRKICETDITNLIDTLKGNTKYLICGTKSFEKDIVKYLKRFEITQEQIKVF